MNRIKTMRTQMYEIILPAMAERNIEETPTNLYYYLKGTVDAVESRSVSIQKFWIWKTLIKSEMRKLKRHPSFKG